MCNMMVVVCGAGGLVCVLDWACAAWLGLGFLQFFFMRVVRVVCTTDVLPREQGEPVHRARTCASVCGYVERGREELVRVDRVVAAGQHGLSKRPSGVVCCWVRLLSHMVSGALR